MYKSFLKPFFDFIFSLLLILILSPIFVLIIILLYFFNQKNVFFFQSRPGKNEKVFQIIKFKTMTDQKDEAGNLLPDEFRLTKMGKFVRKTSLDELPQLFNVLKGDMSFIGPRPLLVSYLSLYNEEQKKRHLIKPGITGWAQVNGRNTITWEQKFIYDVYYVNNMSFLLDVKILLMTIKKVIKSEGINTAGQATTVNFEGNGN
ncbi:sugar transferase [Epilithonimonas arachidiradicis]|uniref:Undecaprenyl phosphate N,N'-diacetylbacillosamine 1-phosphate transferase n=2 Tax=Epilithonimonas arachidiradicis TaxID=1617282 RepID=A0A420DBY2_9FLAO|nr:sugar transferase [Epilithonimonas arachidiradicis]RKE88999.1 undecaprenyl phosphate N,N'-diacetylbacillosamine 1-phosphate transferase [Epilithonimonas arachidiradicis]